MTHKSTLEEEVRSMKKHFVGLVALVKDLKAKVWGETGNQWKFRYQGDCREAKTSFWSCWG